MEPPLQEPLCCDGPAFWTTEPPLKCLTDTIWPPDDEMLLPLRDALAEVLVDALGFEVDDAMLPVFKKSLLKSVSKTFARLGKNLPAVRAIELKPAIASGSITFRSGSKPNPGGWSVLWVTPSIAFVQRSATVRTRVRVHPGVSKLSLTD